jgi:transposase-like protein
MNEENCLIKVLQLCHGRRSGWVTLGDPPRLRLPHCPRCGGTELRIHRKHRAPVLDYRCLDCKRVFNCLTGTAFQGTHRRPSELVKLILGVANCMTSTRLAKNNGWQRAWLVSFRRRLERLDWLEALRERGELAKQRTNGVTLPDLIKELR